MPNRGCFTQAALQMIAEAGVFFEPQDPEMPLMPGMPILDDWQLPRMMPHGGMLTIGGGMLTFRRLGWSLIQVATAAGNRFMPLLGTADETPQPEISHYDWKRAWIVTSDLGRNAVTTDDVIRAVPQLEPLGSDPSFALYVKVTDPPPINDPPTR